MKGNEKDSKLSIVEEYEKQKRELTQSLQYASYIQNALMPKPQAIERSFPDYFLLYMPRDIVSGDFYWVARKKKFTYFAICDCTGHGVPGAFLSILGISFLNQIVDLNESISAANVLNLLREHFMKSLQQTGTEQEQKDGIDMSLCVIDREKGQLQYAGAFNPMYLIKNSSKLIEVPGDKMPIGIAAELETAFVNHSFDLSEGDTVYLFSDGYADQFGGEKGKKFKYRPFRNLLLGNCSKPMEIQKQELTNSLTDWMGDIPQLDDITVFGFRYLP